MEDRLTRTRSGGRSGTAVGALLAIVVITAGWWALALWPSGDASLEWLERTRAACFGAPPGGLPDTRGWILLIGEPLGLVALLAVVWPGALRADVRRLRQSVSGRISLVALPMLVIALLAIAVQQVVTGRNAHAFSAVEAGRLRRDVVADLSDLVLVDQHGESQSLELLADRGALLTAAFSHCATVCPTVVHDLMRARNQSSHPDLAVVVITVDPWRDTPGRLANIAATWELGPDDLVLSGSVDSVNAVLDRLAVARSRNTTNGDVVHVPVVFRLGGGGVTARLDGGWGTVAALIED